MMNNTPHASKKLYFFGGLNGVGKSTFLREIGEHFPDTEVFKGSSRFMEWLGLQPGDYTSLRALPDNYKDSQLDMMMRNIVRKPRDRVLLIDAHYLNYKAGELLEATGEWLGSMSALFWYLLSQRLYTEDCSKITQKYAICSLRT